MQKTVKTVKIENIEFESTLENHPHEVSICEIDDPKNPTPSFFVSQANYSTLDVPVYPWAPNMILPGHGFEKDWKEKNIKCGQPRKVYKSKSGSIHIKHYNCHRLSCPKCYPHTSQNNAVDYYSEILAPRMQGIYEKNRESGKFYHQVWSVDPIICGLDKNGQNYDEKEDILKEKVEYYLKHAAFNLMNKYNKQSIKYLASFVIVHPWRLKKTCNICGSLVSHDSNVCGIHNKGKKDEFYCDSKSFHDFEWVQGFHLHLISNFYADKLDMNNFNSDCAKLHVTHKNISTSKRPLYYWSKNDIVNILSYQLTHAKYTPGHNTKCITWGYFNPKYHKILEKTEITKAVVDKEGNPYIEQFFNLKPHPLGWKLEDLKSKLESCFTAEEKLKFYLFEKSYKYKVDFHPGKSIELFKKPKMVETLRIAPRQQIDYSCEPGKFLVKTDDSAFIEENFCGMNIYYKMEIMVKCVYNENSYMPFLIFV